LYRRAFDEDFPICWFLYEEATGVAGSKSTSTADRLTNETR
jgi:hypothetical protein